MKRLSLIVLVGLVITLSYFVWAETITLTTYYPAPYGVYKEMRSQRMAIGDTYYDGSQYCWEGTCTTTIDSAADLIVEGNVGIGTTSPNALLNVYKGASGATPTINYGDTFVIEGASTGLGMSFLSPNTGEAQSIYFGDVASPNQALIRYHHGTNKMSFDTAGGSDDLVIDSAGNVGIGTTSPSTKLTVLGSSGTRFLYSTSAASASTIYPAADAGGLMFRTDSGLAGASAAFSFETYSSGYGTRMAILGNGSITSACPSGCSDKRSKTNIKDVTGALDLVTAMRAVSFNWKDSTNMSKGRQIGFIGQEMEEILPEVVTIGEWNGIKDYKAIKYDCIVPVLAEAIQELKAENETLEARLEALEAKLR